jgi:hypothetical protein
MTFMAIHVYMQRVLRASELSELYDCVGIDILYVQFFFTLCNVFLHFCY